MHGKGRIIRDMGARGWISVTVKLTLNDTESAKMSPGGNAFYQSCKTSSVSWRPATSHASRPCRDTSKRRCNRARKAAQREVAALVAFGVEGHSDDRQCSVTSGELLHLPAEPVLILVG